MNKELQIVLGVGLVLVTLVGEVVGCQLGQLSMAHEAGWCYSYNANPYPTWKACEPREVSE